MFFALAARTFSTSAPTSGVSAKPAMSCASRPWRKACVGLRITGLPPTVAGTPSTKRTALV